MYSNNFNISSLHIFTNYRLKYCGDALNGLQYDEGIYLGVFGFIIGGNIICLPEFVALKWLDGVLKFVNDGVG